MRGRLLIGAGVAVALAGAWWLGRQSVVVPQLVPPVPVAPVAAAVVADAAVLIALHPPPPSGAPPLPTDIEVKEPANFPYPVENMQGAVGQQRGNHTTLRCPLAIGFSTAHSLLHSALVYANYRGFEPLLDVVQYPPIDNARSHHGHEFGVRNAVKVLRQISINDLGVAGPQRIGDVVHGIVGRPISWAGIRTNADRSQLQKSAR